MKRIITSFFSALLLCGFSQAQVSKESYDEAVDLLNCKTVELSLKNDKNLPDFQKKCPCGATSYTQINQFLSSVKLDATIALSNEVEGLKKSFKENWKKEDVVTFLSESIFTDKTKFQKINAFAEKRKGKPEFETYKAGLKADLSAKLVENAPQQNVEPTTTSVQQSTLEERVAELEKNQNNKKGDNGILGGLADYLIILSILLGVFALVKNLRKSNGEEDYDILVNRLIESQRMNSHFQSQNIYRNTQNNYVSSNELKDANNRIRDLELQVKNLNDQIQSVLILSNSTTQISQSSNPESIQPEKRAEIFFLSTPNSDGSFNESSASFAHKEGATIYRFTKIGSNRAHFQIDEKDASAKLALQYPDKNIDPVCDAVNAFNPKATRITTVEQGEAELQGNKWIINRKVKIRYEN